MTREEIQEQYKWNLKEIFASDDEFENTYREVQVKIKEFSKHERIIGDNGTNFYNAIKDLFEIKRLLDKLYVYANMKFRIDTTNNQSQVLQSRVNVLYDESNKATFFVTRTILKKDYQEIEQFYRDEPKLLEYEVLLKRDYRAKKHLLTDIEEKLLLHATKNFGNASQIYTLLTTSDLTFGTIEDEEGNEVVLTSSNYDLYKMSPNRDVRRNAFQVLYKTYRQFSNTFASIMSSYIKDNVTIAELRKHGSVRGYFMYDEEIEESIYDNLIDAISSNMNVLYKYYALKQQLLELDELHLYDIYPPIVKDFDKEYSFEEAKNIVLSSLQILGEEYVSILKQGYDNNWCDVYPNDGKVSGAFSGGCYGTAPYILLNFQGTYSDVSTLAHESGHSMNAYYVRQNNPYQYGYSHSFIAEVASTVNELLLAINLLNNSQDNNEKLFILNSLMELFKVTLYRQTMFAEFEKAIYTDAENNIPLTSEHLGDKYYELSKKYFGENVVVDEEVRCEWASIPHFYYDFYVYKYATGLSAACHIVNNILNGKPNAVTNYINFLKTGSNLSPIDALKVAGVDLTKKEVIESAIKMFDDIINEFKKIHEETRQCDSDRPKARKKINTNPINV